MSSVALYIPLTFFAQYTQQGLEGCRLCIRYADCWQALLFKVEIALQPARGVTKGDTWINKKCTHNAAQREGSMASSSEVCNTTLGCSGRKAVPGVAPSAHRRRLVGIPSKLREPCTSEKQLVMGNCVIETTPVSGFSATKTTGVST